LVKTVFTIIIIIPMMFEFLDVFLDTYYLQEVTDNDEIYLNAPNSVYRTMVAFIYLGLGKTIVTFALFALFVGEYDEDEEYDEHILGFKFYSLGLTFLFEGNGKKLKYTKFIWLEEFIFR